MVFGLFAYLGSKSESSSEGMGKMRERIEESPLKGVLMTGYKYKQINLNILDHDVRSLLDSKLEVPQREAWLFVYQLLYIIG